MIRTVFFLMPAFLLAACGSAPGPSGGAIRPQVPSSSGWEGREKVGEAIELLNKGDAPRARKLLEAVVDRQPGDAIAAKLIRQIDSPPEVVLGSQSFAYTARAGDSFSSLAGRFLGDPMLFYALARYNGVTAAGTLEPGRALRIPGRERKAPVPARTPAAPRPKTEAKPAPKAAAPAPAPAAAANPARALQLRAAGLEQMNRGAINRAVALLRQATRFDPANPLIQRDLERALNIQRTVHAKP